MVFARCALEATTAGKLGIQLNDARGITLWVDGKAAETRNNLALDVAQGVHTLIFRVDLTQGPAGLLRCEVAEVPGSAAQGRFVTRK
jgi:hypothetical protein